MTKVKIKCFREWHFDKFGFKNPMTENQQKLSSRQRWLLKNRKSN
jgi:hypothetical protein